LAWLNDSRLVVLSFESNNAGLQAFGLDGSAVSARCAYTGTYASTPEFLGVPWIQGLSASTAFVPPRGKVLDLTSCAETVMPLYQRAAAQALL
jgi:hypothetical protein